MTVAAFNLCSPCGAENPASARFCMDCGAALPQSCPACGTAAPAKARFCIECGAALNAIGGASADKSRSCGPVAPPISTPRHIAERILRSREAMQGERKAVTVLFADIRGSTSLIEHRDPEEAGAVLEPVLRRMIEAVHRFDGLVTKVMGDGLMALFGAPLAMEDHAVRACFSAISMRDAVQEKAAELRRAHGIEVQIRIGLNSGDVVVQGIGSDLHMEYDAIGATVHLAARMEQMAPPGRIRLTDSTAGLAGGSMDLEELGPVPVAGFSEPVPVFELLSSAEPELRAEASAQWPLVGRAAELEVLRGAAQRARHGRGQLVVVAGDPGMGKSRLCLELLRELRGEGWLCLSARAAPHEKSEPWLAIRRMTRSFFGGTAASDAQKLRDRITACDTALAASAPALLELMGASIRDPDWDMLKPAERRQRMIDACRAWLVSESRSRPVLILADDFQWVDTETEALLRALADVLSGAPMLLLVSSRIEENERSLLNAATSIRLQPLSVPESEELLGHLLGANAVSGSVLSGVIERTGGNPLFATEIARALADGDGISAETLPPSVQAIIAARIDALPAPEKTLLQAASVLGNEFELGLLAETAMKHEEDARALLGRLQARGFVQERRIFPEVSFGFDQPLVQEVAYRGMLKERRRELHRGAFVALFQQKGEHCAISVGGLAHHSFEACLWDEAARFCRLAARRAAAQSAYPEAASLYRNALSALAETADSDDRRRLEIDLAIELRHVLFPITQFDEIGTVLAKAHARARELGDRGRLGLVLMHETTHHLGAGRHSEAIRSGLQALAIADDLEVSHVQRDVLFHLVQANASLGEYAAAIRLGSRLVGLPIGGPAGVTTSSLARMWLAWCSAELGRFEEAHGHSEAAFAVSRESGQPLPMLLAHLGRGLSLLREEEFEEASAWLEPAFSYCENPSLRAWWGAVGSPLGRAWLGIGRVGEAVSLLERVVAHSTSSRGSGHVLRTIHLGEAYLAQGRIAEAAGISASALDLARGHGERGHEGYALLLDAEISFADHRPEAALSSARAAAELSTELGMIPLQDRIARMLRRCGLADESDPAAGAAPARSVAMRVR